MNVDRKILLNPGPATTTDSVKFAQVVPDICPREREFGDLMEYVSVELTKIVADPDYYTTVLFAGSGTAVVESVISSVIPHGKKALIINNGAYGDRMCQIASSYGIDYIEFKSSPVEPIILDTLKDIIVSDSDISHLVVVHNETTTGLLNDLNDLGAIAAKFNLGFIVDAMSSYAAIPISMVDQKIDFLCASSNKNIQGMAGVGFVIGSTEKLQALNSIRPRNFYLNLFAQYENFTKSHQMRFTPPVQTLYALKQAIVEFKEETLQGRCERYSKSCERLKYHLKEIGLTYLVDDDYHSKIITAIELPDGVDFDHMHDHFFENDITIYPGKIGEFNTFRIANIGDIDHRDIDVFCEMLKQYLTEFGVS